MRVRVRVSLCPEHQVVGDDLNRYDVTCAGCGCPPTGVEFGWNGGSDVVTSPASSELVADTASLDNVESLGWVRR